MSHDFPLPPDARGYPLKAQKITAADFPAKLNGAESEGTPGATPPFRIINPADWEGLSIPSREWIVPDWIPHKTVTLLYGDGATGKSLLAMQLCAARALAKDWIGLLPEPGRSLTLSAEDDGDEMHRRLEDIRRFYGASMRDLFDMRLIDLVGADCVLGALMRGQIMPTEMFGKLDAYLTEWKPHLAVLDVLADMFSGDENNRPQARQFIGLLKGLCRKHSCAFLLLAHPSLTGMNSGTGTSGSTGWNNAVRSRLYLQTVKADDGLELNKNLRVLESKKANYGLAGTTIALEWKNGLFTPVQSNTSPWDNAAVDALFLRLLDQFTREGRNATAKKGTSYAPAEFAGHADAKGLGKEAFKRAMDRLLKSGEIENLEYGRPSTRRSKLVIRECTP